MILFLVINTSSVQLLPTSMIALRAQAGAASPADIVLPTLLATAVSTVLSLIHISLICDLINAIKEKGQTVSRMEKERVPAPA